MPGFQGRIDGCLGTLGITLAACLATAPASAALTYVFESSGVEQVPGVLKDVAAGVDMRDLQVTILRTDGETDTRTWGASNPNGVVGIGWSIGFGTADTGLGAWGVANSLSHAPIQTITLAGKPGRVLFDVDMYNLDLSKTCAQHAPSGGLPQACSAGSAQGRRFSYQSGDFDATVTYSDPVGLAGAAPVGDLFYTLTIEFAGSGMGASAFSFFQDTDIAARGVVPLPPAAPLLGAALVGLWATRGRRARG